MAGHSHWKQIKEHKGSADQKRSRMFSKLLTSISIAAKKEPNPQFNPRLRAAIEKAKENQVPQDNIERAIKRATLREGGIEELLIEAYGPAGEAIIIEAASVSRNRTINELKQIFKDFGGRMVGPGGVRWAFEPPADGNVEWRAKFPQALSEEEKTKTRELIKALEEHEDVQRVYTNVKW